MVGTYLPLTHQPNLLIWLNIKRNTVKYYINMCQVKLHLQTALMKKKNGSLKLVRFPFLSPTVFHQIINVVTGNGT